MPPIDRREYLRAAGGVVGLPALGRVARAKRHGAVDRRQAGSPDTPLAPTALRTEYEESPNNLPPVTDPVTAGGADPADSNGEREPFVPRFSWRAPAPERGAGQRAYRLLVASTPELLEVGVADVYDSGKVASGESTAVSFAREQRLDPDATYYWAVRVWNADDEPSPWSEPAQFTMAIPDDPDHWEGTWITGQPANADPSPKQAGPARDEESPLLRTDVTLEKEVVRARAHVLTLGYGDLYVNGEAVDDAVLDPAWTNYRRRVLFRSYDVTDALDRGENALGLWLGRGWFAKEWEISTVRVGGIIAGGTVEGATDTNFAHAVGSDEGEFGPPAALVQVNVEYADGTTESIVTDTSWRTHPSPIVENDVWEGETYDALLEQPGWATPDFEAAGWLPAAEHPFFEGPVSEHSTDVETATTPGDPAIRPQRTQPIEVTETLEPVSVRSVEDGYVVDFGQNFAGWVELTFRDAVGGEVITIDHAEILDDDGDIDDRSHRTAASEDTYVAKGADEEVYEPRFTYHGFRYAKVSGYPGDLTTDDVRGRVVHTGFEQTGSFACSNEDLTQVQRNAVWGLRSNVHSVPTDCPQRDERYGWTGDATITAPTDLLNFDAVRFYEKWLRDHAVNQDADGTVSDTIPHARGSRPADPNWGKTRVTIPWFLYRYTGDERVLADHYEGMKAYVDFWHEEVDDHIVPDSSVHYGDWLAPEGPQVDSEMTGTFAHYQTTEMVAKAAAVLGRSEDAKQYAARTRDIGDAFNAAFFDAATGRYGSGAWKSYAYPLFLGIVPDEHEDAVLANFIATIREADAKIQTGFPATRPLLFALVDHGFEELAYRIVSQPEMPGWVFMVRQGATTLWERWDAPEHGPGMNSYNHRNWPQVSEWFYRVLAGVDAAEPGFEHVDISPAVVGDVEWAEGATETVRGEVASRWERTDEGLSLAVTIPWNSTGTVRVPDLEAADVVVREGGRLIWHDRRSHQPPKSLPAGVESVSRTDDAVVLEVGSGSYDLELGVLDDGEEEEDDREDGEDDGGDEPVTEPARPGGNWMDYTFEAEVDIEQHSAGIVFRAQDFSNLYMWQVSYDTTSVELPGAYVLTRHVMEDGTWQAFERVPFVVAEPHDTLPITIELRGEEITTYANGQHVDTTTDGTYAEGTIGFRAAGGAIGDHMLVDSVTVSDPAGDVLFDTDFSHDSLTYFSDGTITDDRLELAGTGIVLRV